MIPPCQGCSKLKCCTKICYKMFSCKECLIVSVCKKFCDNIYNKSCYTINKLLSEDVCPDCGTKNIFNVGNRDFYPYKVKCRYCNHIFLMIKYCYTGREQE